MQDNLTRNLIWLVALALLVALVWALSDILLPFIAGFIIAYFLDPVADRLEKTGLPRLAATAFITAMFTLVLILIALFGLPVLAEQLLALVEVLPGYVEAVRLWVAGLGETGQVAELLEKLSGDAVNQLAGLGQNLLLHSLSFLNLLALLFITPIVSFYMLNDWDKMTARLDKLLPAKQAPAIREIARQVDEVLDGFIHGQTLVCITLAVIYMVGLSLAGLKGAILVGVLAGLVSFIPYVGAIFGIVLAGVLAVIQFWPDWSQMLLVGLVFVAGQFIEGNFLTPRLVGDRVRLHPVWIMFALLAFGSLLGFVGLLLAVPIAAILGVLVRHMVGYYETDINGPQSEA